MYLVDTNIWLERLLGQTRSAEVAHFLANTSTDRLFVSDFALHSICIILDRLGQRDALLQFVDDVFIDGNVLLVSVLPEAMPRVVEVMGSFNLDFDDAYQYVAAEQVGAVIVSFDTDFDRTASGRLVPADVPIG